MDCPDISRIESEAFANALRKVRRPYKASIEVTARCNNRCPHCYLDPAGHPNPPEMPLEFHLELMDALAAEQCLWLALTGGEPMIRPDFPQLYEGAKRRGFIVTIYSNACLVTPEIADLLYEMPPRVVSISVYGATQKTYETVTGTPGSFEAAMNGIRLLHERGIPLRIKTMVLRTNAHELEQMRAFAASVGSDLQVDACVQPTVFAGMGPLQYRLSPAEAVRLDIDDPARRESWELMSQKHRGQPAPTSRFICDVAQSGLYVTAEGHVCPCVVARSFHWPLDLSDVRGSLARIFYEKFPSALAGDLSCSSPCARCGLRHLCPACFVWRELESGSGEAPCLWACELANLRAQAVGDPGQLPENLPSRC
jgi:MoaA/NifB/PqqE/SkfB family radical SAM enzyme